MEKPLEMAWVGPQVECVRVSRNYQGEVNSVSRVGGDSDMAPAFQLCGFVVVGGRGWHRKRTMVSASTSI